MNLPESLSKSEGLIQWIDAKIDAAVISSGLRFRLAAGCLDVAHEHHKAIVLLVANRLYGSAFSLVRLIFEAYVRGAWLHQRANDADLRRFESDNVDKTFAALVDEIEELDPFQSRILSAAKSQSWAAMNSFTHSGFSQVVRRNTPDSIEPDYSEGEILEALRFANAIALLSAAEIALLARNDRLASEILERSKSEWTGVP
jgi:hypothetical protein